MCLTHTKQTVKNLHQLADTTEMRSMKPERLIVTRGNSQMQLLKPKLKFTPFRSRESCKALKWDGRSYRELLDMNLAVAYNRDSHDLLIRAELLSPLVQEGSIYKSVANPGDMIVRDRDNKLYAMTEANFNARWYRSGR